MTLRGRRCLELAVPYDDDDDSDDDNEDHDDDDDDTSRNFK